MKVKYFLNLERRHYKQGTISELKLDDEQFVSTDKEIVKPSTNAFTVQAKALKMN